MGHFCQRPTWGIDALISHFWSSDFDMASEWSASYYAVKNNYGCFREWKALTLEQAIAKLSWNPITLNDFILQCIDGLPTLIKWDDL